MLCYKYLVIRYLSKWMHSLQIVPLIVFVSASSAMYNVGGGRHQFDLSEFSVGDTKGGNNNVVNTEFEVPSFNSLFNFPNVNVYTQNSLNNNQER